MCSKLRRRFLHPGVRLAYMLRGDCLDRVSCFSTSELIICLLRKKSQKSQVWFSFFLEATIELCSRVRKCRNHEFASRTATDLRMSSRNSSHISSTHGRLQMMRRNFELLRFLGTAGNLSIMLVFLVAITGSAALAGECNDRSRVYVNAFQSKTNSGAPVSHQVSEKESASLFTRKNFSLFMRKNHVSLSDRFIHRCVTQRIYSNLNFLTWKNY